MHRGQIYVDVSAEYTADKNPEKQTENNGGVNYYQNSEDGMNQIIQEAMRQSGNIPPTLTKNQGERVGIFVARDVDFSKVYQLKPTSR